MVTELNIDFGNHYERLAERLSLAGSSFNGNVPAGILEVVIEESSLWTRIKPRFIAGLYFLRKRWLQNPHPPLAGGGLSYPQVGLLRRRMRRE